MQNVTLLEDSDVCLQKALQGSDDLEEQKDPGRCTVGLGDGYQLAQEASSDPDHSDLLEQPSARHRVLGLLSTQAK